MSRIGKRILEVPAGVTVTVENGVVKVTGTKGTLELKLHENLSLNIEEGKLSIDCNKNDKQSESMYGTTNALISNMITGVSKGYEKGLEIIGVGYRFAVKGNELEVTAGKSHKDLVKIPEGLTVEQVSNTEVTIKGISKELVGEFAAKVRKLRKPEPYKGKGIRYKDEFIRRKEGKKASK
ncbi:MAG: 50S ribosomal protein L6 [Bacilli bacterium]|nr:50S ribosomal protein L6 [Bacilli bacterium]